MANDNRLIYAADARRAVLKADPKLAYCIDKIPAVDAVEVVRCEDCAECTKSNWCNLLLVDVKGEWFCCHGKRRNHI